MAGLPCTMCANEVAILLVTSLADGDTQNIGVNCMPVFALGMAAGVMDGMPVELADALSEVLDAIYASDPRPSKPTATSKPRKRSTARSEPPGGTPESTPGELADPPADECPICGAMVPLSELDAHACPDDPSLDGHEAE